MKAKPWERAEIPRPGREDALPAEAPAHATAAAALARGPAVGLLRGLLGLLGNPPVAFELWDDRSIATSAEPPVARIKIRDRRTLARLLLDPTLQFGECYSEGLLEVEGDLIELLQVVDRSWGRLRGKGLLGRLLLRGRRRPRSNSREAARHNVHHHYDIGNEFYSLWLDENLVYTCAYFAEPGQSLEQAQRSKFDHVCRKLRLQPGETVVEAGSGWGTLALHMARHYGVRVEAFNVSEAQVAYARERAARELLDDRVRFHLADWREIRVDCDAFVSVGMLEHVGPDRYRELGRIVDRSLRRHGRGLIHTIGRNAPRPLDRWIDRRIFPGAHPPTLREMMEIFEGPALSVLDVENLRLHYAKTLRHWLERFERAADRVERLYDARFVRMWRLYLSGSVAAFEGGALQLFQVLFARERLNELAWTRDHLVGPAARGENHAPPRDRPWKAATS